ncbi:MAG: SIS domain-containing protein [Ghiorsea sp.]|nr:SIS domain-containing protein [Ghiorsea sp.]
MKKIIHEALEAGIVLRKQCLNVLDDDLLQAAEVMVSCLRHDGKILVCGNGGSASDAQHFVAELVNRFEINRPALAAFAMVNDASVITSISNDFSFNSIFARQTEALGRKGDVLLGISTSGHSKNVIQAVTKAQAIGMDVIVLTGKDGGELGQHPSVTVSININHSSTARVQEMHITCLHILCSLIDETMFGSERES